MAARPCPHPRGPGDEAGAPREWAPAEKSWEMLAVYLGVMRQARGAGPLSPASSQRRELSPAQKCPRPLLIPSDFPFCQRPKAGRGEARPGGPRVAQGWSSRLSHCRTTSRYSCRCGEWGFWDTGRQRVAALLGSLPSPTGAPLSYFSQTCCLGFPFCTVDCRGSGRSTCIPTQAGRGETDHHGSPKAAHRGHSLSRKPVGTSAKRLVVT